jgi:hypothetical protein
VTGLFYPSNPDIPENFAIMGATFPPQTDFRIDVSMGWDTVQFPQRLLFNVGPGGSVATFGYRFEPGFGQDPIIMASASGASQSIVAPPPGIHQFAIARVAARFEFYLDGNLLTTLPDLGVVTPATGIAFGLVGPYPGPLVPLHIDRVQVIPAPGGALLLAPLALICARRR